MPDCFSKYFSDLFFNFVVHVALLFFKVGTKIVDTKFRSAEYI